MNSILLGIVQGLTEFLPVSSSGHLVIFQNILPGFSQPGVLFDVVLHFGTVISVLFFYRKKLIELITEYFWQIIIASIPAGIAGILFSDFFEGLFSNIKLVGFALLVTALLNYLTHRSKEKNISLTQKNSFFVGIAQALAIVPGISRSGSTIFTGSILGINKEKTAEFSFLLSVPAIVGANVLQVFKYANSGSINYLQYLLGFAASFFAGILAIKMVLNFIKKGEFKYFSYYCFIVGILVILFLN